MSGGLFTDQGSFWKLPLPRTRPHGSAHERDPFGSWVAHHPPPLYLPPTKLVDQLHPPAEQPPVSPPPTAPAAPNDTQPTQAQAGLTGRWKVPRRLLAPACFRPPITPLHAQRLPDLPPIEDPACRRAIEAALVDERDVRPNIQELALLGDALTKTALVRTVQDLSTDSHNGRQAILMDKLKSNNLYSYIAVAYQIVPSTHPKYKALGQKHFADIFEAYIGALERSRYPELDALLRGIFSPAALPALATWENHRQPNSARHDQPATRASGHQQAHHIAANASAGRNPPRGRVQTLVRSTHKKPSKGKGKGKNKKDVARRRSSATPGLRERDTLSSSSVLRRIAEGNRHVTCRTPHMAAEPPAAASSTSTLTLSQDRHHGGELEEQQRSRGPIRESDRQAYSPFSQRPLGVRDPSDHPSTSKRQNPTCNGSGLASHLSTPPAARPAAELGHEPQARRLLEPLTQLHASAVESVRYRTEALPQMETANEVSGGPSTGISKVAAAPDTISPPIPQHQGRHRPRFMTIPEGAELIDLTKDIDAPFSALAALGPLPPSTLAFLSPSNEVIENCRNFLARRGGPAA